MKNAVLVLDKKAQAIVVPPPKKSEMIEALAIRRREQLIKEKNDARIEVDRLEKEIDAELIELVSKVKEFNWRPQFYTDTRGSEVFVRSAEVTCKVDLEGLLKQSTRSKMIKQRQLQTKAWRAIPTLNEVKSEIRASMAGHTPTDSRVAALLADPSVSKAMDATLKELFDPKAPKPTVVESTPVEV